MFCMYKMITVRKFDFSQRGTSTPRKKLETIEFDQSSEEISKIKKVMMETDQ